MEQVITIGLDLAKSVFQAHGADAAGGVVFRKKLRRDQMLAFFADQPPCLVALAPAASTFRRGRDFAAWLGLTPRQHSSGGKERLGRTTKMGERCLRRLLIIGASSAAKAASREGGKSTPWLRNMLAKKPRMLVTVALANKIARIVWALMAHGGTYKAPIAAT